MIATWLISYKKLKKNYLFSFFLVGCGEKWTLDQFYVVHEKIIPGDFDTECKVDEQTRSILSYHSQNDNVIEKIEEIK